MSAWRRQRSFTSLHPTKSNALPKSPLVELSWKQFTSSLTWGVPSHQTSRSTGKSTEDWPKLMALSINSTKEYGTASIWIRALRSASIAQSYALSICKAPSHRVTYRLYLRLLERFHQQCLCTILNIYWSNYVTNIEVLDQVEITCIEAMLLKSRLSWAGHISRMVDHRLPKIALYGELSTGHHDRGEPKKTF